MTCQDRVSFGLALTLLGAIPSCGGDGDTPPAPSAPLIAPGSGIGPVRIGMRYHDLRARYGEMDNAVVSNRFVVGGYPDQALDIIMTSSEDSTIASDAVVIAVGAKTDAFSGFPRPGMSRAEIEAALGPAPVKAGSIEYYPSGVSIDYRSDAGADTAKAVGVFPPFAFAPTPPEMQPASSKGGV